MTHIIFALFTICTESTNTGININTKIQGANATILSALHDGTSLYLVNSVASGPWYIQNTHSVLSLTHGKRHLLAMNVFASDECIC